LRGLYEQTRKGALEIGVPVRIAECGAALAETLSHDYRGRVEGRYAS
jgi:hypothetical protein